MLQLCKRVISRLRSRWVAEGFLRDVSGVVHVGANTGQERDGYAKHGLRVVWVEPIPQVFQTLRDNLKNLPAQRAVQALVSDRDDAACRFHISNNEGRSSSILELKLHKDVWPEVDYTSTIELKSVTLATLFNREQIDPAQYQALVLDTQGSELLVLRGATPVLKSFKYIKVEVPDFEAYAGCCQLPEIEAFMKEHGYAERARRPFARRQSGGSYFDIIYRRVESRAGDR